MNDLFSDIYRETDISDISDKMIINSILNDIIRCLTYDNSFSQYKINGNSIYFGGGMFIKVVLLNNNELDLTINFNICKYFPLIPVIYCINKRNGYKTTHVTYIADHYTNASIIPLKWIDHVRVDIEIPKIDIYDESTKETKPLKNFLIVDSLFKDLNQYVDFIKKLFKNRHIVQVNVETASVKIDKHHYFSSHDKKDIEHLMPKFVSFKEYYKGSCYVHFQRQSRTSK